MRILAIRGCNLASLAGEFEIDLANGPLGASGVFAIVGNTGAGKSTLLDALCVALFDRTPRLANHSRVVVGRGDEDPHALGSQDVRTLLRRGASSGWAEVDFESGDARRYRARWSVRRARGQADGALQAQQVSLTSLDGSERLGGTKTETLDAIHERLGLTFDQFRRSALLAQGDFAAFLRADGKDRGELLERMTGTEIYTRLSIAAHANATAALAKLDAERTRADAIPVLADAERQGAEQELRFAGAAKTAARTRLVAAETAARWLFESATRADGVRAAEASHASATASLDQAGALRDELALRRRVESLRGPWEHVQRAERQLGAARGEASTAREAAASSLVVRDVTRAQHAELAEVLVPLRAARIAAGLVERAPQAVSGRSVHVDVTAGQASGRSSSNAGQAFDRNAHVDAQAGQMLTRNVHVDATAGQTSGRSGSNAGQTFDRNAHVGAQAGQTFDRNVHVDAQAGQMLTRNVHVDATAGQAFDRNAHVDAAAGQTSGRSGSNAGQTFERNAHVGARAGQALDLDVDVDATPGQPSGRSGSAAGQTFDRSVDVGARAGQALELDVHVDAAAGQTSGRSGSNAGQTFDRNAHVGAAYAALAIGRGASADAAWLRARTALATEVAGWNDLDAKFAQYGTAANSANGLARSLAEHTERREKLKQSRAALATEVRAATDKHTDAQRKAETFNKKRGLTLEAARRAEDAARVRKTDVEALVALAASARSSRAACAELDAHLAELAASATADSEARTGHETSRTTALTLRTERARVVAELRKAAGYEHARAELVDGDPCPLCGAEEHPWHHRGALDDVIVSADKALDAAAAQLDAATAAIAQIDARTAQRKTDRTRLTKQRTTAQVAADAAAPTWAESIAALGELLIVTDPASAEAEKLAADLLVAAGKALDAARTTRSQTEAATKAAAEAQAEVALSQNNLDQLSARATELDRKLAEIDAAIGRLDGERTMRAERCAELVRELLSAAMRWRAATEERADVSAETARGGAGSRAAASAAKRTARGTNGTGAAADATELATHRAWMSEITTAWRSRAENVARAESVVAGAAHAALDELQFTERAVVELSARAAEAEKRVADLMATARAANDELAQARASITRAPNNEIAATGSNARATSADQPAARTGVDSTARATSADQPAARVDSTARATSADQPSAPAGVDSTACASRADQLAARTTVELTDETLRELLGIPATHLDELAMQLASLERSMETTRAILAERRRLADAHRATQPDALDTFPAGADARSIAIMLDELSEAARMAEEHAATLTGALAADADARARREQLQALLVEAERAADVDRVLGAAIGSHDGKRFRSFAQSLTLDGLLTVANAHLVELAPRYQLERVPKHDLELQVIDRDLGDEVRSVQSLSGGESFLVSLALALGLSSMSAHDVRVRTLLIDEGFGTLDPSTLEMALSVLEALRQQGRQVGVISHVPQLVERVGAHVKVIARGGGRSEVVVA